MNDDLQERIDHLEMAQDLLREAVDEIKHAVRRTHLENGAHAYIIPSLKMCLSDDHEYLGGQPYNVAEMIEALTTHEDDDEE